MLLPKRDGWNILLLGTTSTPKAIAVRSGDVMVSGRSVWFLRLQQRYFSNLKIMSGYWTSVFAALVTFRVSNLVGEPIPGFSF